MSTRQKPDNEPLLFYVVSDAAIWVNDTIGLMLDCFIDLCRVCGVEYNKERL